MKMKNLGVLVLVAAVVIGWAWWSSTRKARQYQPPPDIGRLALPALDDATALNSIAQIRFENPGYTVVVARANGEWVAPTRDNYPLDFDKVREFLRMAAAMKVGQVLPVDADRRSVGLLPPPADATNEVRQTPTSITLADDAGKTVASFQIGKERIKEPTEEAMMFGNMYDGCFIGVGDKIYVVTDNFRRLPRTDKDWINSSLLNLQAAEIKEISVTDTNGQSFTLTRAAAEDSLALPGLAADEETDPARVNTLSGMFGGLFFTDVMSAANTNLVDRFAPAVTLAARTWQGETYTMTVGGDFETSGDRYVKLQVDIPPDVLTNLMAAATNMPPMTTSLADQAKADLKKYSAEILKWVYVAPSYRLNDINITRDQLIKQRDTNAPPAVTAVEADMAAPGGDMLPAEVIMPDPMGDALPGQAMVTIPAADEPVPEPPPAPPAPPPSPDKE